MDAFVSPSMEGRIWKEGLADKLVKTVGAKRGRGFDDLLLGRRILG